MELGQKVYLEPIGNNARYSNEIRESRISKIGRKYFELEQKHYGRFFIESMKQDCGEYISGYIAYLSLQEIEEKREAERLFSKLKKVFYGISTNLPLYKLKEIERIVNSS